MDIMLEAFEAHSIEQYERKAKYEKRFEEEMEEKVNKWNGIFQRYEQGIFPSHEEISFMIQESNISLDSSYSKDIPYLQDHISRISKEYQFVEAIKNFKEVIPIYHRFLASLYPMYIGMFRKKKKLMKIIEKANQIQNDTKEKSSKLQAFIRYEYTFDEEFKQNKEKLTSITEKHNQSLSLTEEETKWLIHFSRYSIVEQMDTGELFFAHHFQRVNREQSFRKELEGYKKVFLTYQQAIEKIANLTVEMFMITNTLEKASTISRNAIDMVDWIYQKIQRSWNQSA
jgi:hypothetical protein